MTSTAARPLGGDSVSGGTTFSYAQAAKGRAASTTASTAVLTVQPSQATSGANTPPKESTPTTEVLSGIVSGYGTNEIEGSSSVNNEATPKVPSNGPEPETKATPLASATSFPSSPSVGTASTSTLPKEDEALLVPKLAADSPWDRPTQNETSGDKTGEISDRKKGRKSKKDKTAEKETEAEKEEIKPEILVAAPPPAVNFWQQRIEAQAAKAKTSPQVAESAQFSSEDSTANGALSVSAPKSFDSRKKVKHGVEEVEGSVSSGQAGGVRDQTNFLKPQRKGSEANGRPKEDLGGKRSAPRGSRIADREERSTVKNLPPPVEDAISWPTPDTALEERRKAQEKIEKEDKEEGISSNKPRAKEKWVPVPYIPTVTFVTPLPARGRGGRGGGGSRGGAGRGGHTANGSISGDKSFATGIMANNAATEPHERGRDNVSAGRATSLPPNSSNRATGETAYNPRDQRKPSVSTFEKPKSEFSAPPAKGESYAVKDNRRTSIATQTDLFSSSHHESRQQLTDSVRFNKQDSANVAPSENPSQSRSFGAERRSDPNLRMNESQRETNGHGQLRERGEGRPERGRGAYRGRGNHANFQNGQSHSQHPFTNGHTPQAQSVYTIRQNSGPYSPPLQTQQQQQYTGAYPTPGRASRNGPPRSQSIPNSNAIYSRYPPNVTSPTQQMPPLQTVGPVFDYQGMQTMSAVPYNAYMEQYSVLAMVTMQLEYYFSIDNLCKDVFLRKHMDSKGFVFLSTIANFKRIQSLTQDFELLRFACQESEVIDIFMGEDGIDRLRRADGWEKWVLAMEERDEIARNDGPGGYYRQPILLRPQPMAPRLIPTTHSAISPPTFTSNGSEPSFQPYHTLPRTNGTDQPSVYHTESPLSAAVPDFSPNPPSNLLNELEIETTFTDEEVDNLQLVYNHKPQGDAKPKSPFHNASSRTFSNGSIDGRSITEELLDLHKHQGRNITNGDSPGSEVSPERFRRSKSPLAMSPTKIVYGNAPPVMWVKGQKDQAPVTEANKNEPYSVVRARALRHRESSVAGETDNDMKLLYQFWSHFLVRNFNPRMYEEFRSCAIDDAKIHQSTFGITNLIQYYDEVLNSKKKTIPEVLARHYVELVNSEDRLQERLGFAKLRAAWRNGALDMKSRKKVDNFVDPKLREELER